MAVEGVTLRYIVYDILRDLKQRFSGAEISEYQLTYWVLVHADRLRKKHIEKIDSGEYVHVFQVPVVYDSLNRKSIPLPERIYDYDLDKGVAFISHASSESTPGQDTPGGFVSITFSRTTPGAAKMTYWREEELPSFSNPYFYRLNDSLVFLGLETTSLPINVEIGIYSTLNPTDLSLDIDQPFSFPQDLVPVLKRQVLDLGIWTTMVPKDMLADGSNIQGETPQKKFISVNDVSQQEEQ